MVEGSRPQRERSAALLCVDGTYASPDAPRVFPLVGPAVEEPAPAPPPRARWVLGLGAIALLSVATFVALATLSGAIASKVTALALGAPVALSGIAVGLLHRRRSSRAPAASSPDEVASTHASSAEARPASAGRDDEAPTRTLRFDGRSLVLTWQRDVDASPVSSRRSGRARRISSAAIEVARTLPARGGPRKLEERRVLAEIGERFGVTLLSNRKRDRIAAAITSPSGCFLVASRLSFAGGLARASASKGALRVAGGADDAAFLRRATVISSEEVALDAIGPDGEPIELDFRDFRVLIETLETVDPACCDRVLLSDPSGAPLQLDGEDLEVRGRHFDLSRPLEWRSILFQEQFGQALTLYQGTWIRQGAEEVVLVSLLPPSVLDPSPLDFVAAGLPELDLAAMRDQRLMQASAGEPPPIEQRVAVDGLFMLPLRVALDQAPRSSQQPAETRHA